MKKIKTTGWALKRASYIEDSQFKLEPLEIFKTKKEAIEKVKHYMQEEKYQIIKVEIKEI